MLGFRSALIASTGIICVAAAQPAQAQTRRFNVPAQEISRAIPELARQAGIQIVAPADGLENVRSRAVQGTMDVRTALRQMLEGTGLVIASDRDGVILLRVQTQTMPLSGETQAGSTAAEIEDAEQREILVTGSRIRGAQSSSPITTITREEMQRSGQANLGEAIRALPQNFSGGQNPGVALGASAGGISNQNITGSSSLNLRGLGPDASLTLLNGTRLPYDGSFQAIDVSVIPLAAVQRVEVVLDGASAIYGSDAVGGVANIILRRDYNGGEASARVGGATSGGYAARQFTALAGTTWSSGGFLATAEHSENAPVRASQRAFLADMPRQDITIYPDLRQESALVSAHQELTAGVELTVDAFFSQRTQETFSQPSATSISPSRRQTAEWGVNPALNLTLPASWDAKIYGTIARSRTNFESQNINISTNLPTSTSSFRYINMTRSVGVEFEGPLFALPGGSARLSFGGGYRGNDYRLPNLLTGAITADGQSRSYHLYGEANLPLISPQQSIPLVYRFSVNGAVRFEDYQTFGSVVTPKFGAVWEPIAGLRFRGSWGQSFKSPTLDQLYSLRQLVIYSGPTFGAPAGALVLARLGGNRSLDPERADVATLGVTIEPSFAPRLAVQVGWFDIRYRDRVVTPVTPLLQALRLPQFDQFVTLNPTAEQQNQTFALSDSVINASGRTYDPSLVYAIVENTNTNAARQQISGIDLNARYRFQIGEGSLDLVGSASWITKAQQRVTPGSALQPTAGVLFFPARFRSRTGVNWTANAVSLSAYLNHVSGVIDTNVTPNQRRGSNSTVDVAFDYRPSIRSIRDARLSLAVSNLFNRNPPFAQPLQPFQVDYDSTNYSALERVVSLTLTIGM